MAGEQTIGKLVVQVLMDAADYDGSAKMVERRTKNMGSLMERTAAVLNNVFTKAAKAAAAASIGLAAASTAVGAGFERAITQVAAVKGIDKASEEFARLEEQARKLGATTQFSASEAAAGMEELARAGLSTDQIIAASSDTLKVAAATGVSLADAAQIVASSMAQFGLQAQDTARITDVLTVATQNSLFAMNDMAEAMKYAGTAGASVGWTIEEVAAASAQFRDLGLEGSMAGTQLRMVIASLASPTGEAKKALEEMGLTVEDVSPELHSFREIMLTLGDAGMTTSQALTIFSQRAGLNVSMLVSQMQDSTEKFDTLFGKLQQSAGATESTYATMTDNVIGRFLGLKSAVEEFLIGLFETFRGPLSTLLESVTRLVRLVGIQLGVVSGDLGGFGEVLEQFAGWIDDNAQTWAVQIGQVFRLMASIASLLSRTIIPLFQALTPIAAELGVILLATFAASKLSAFITFLYTTISALAAATTAAGGFGAAITAATGGINILTAAIAAILVGLGLYTVETLRARDATESLANETERLRALQEQRDKTLEVGIARRLAARKAELMVERESLDLSTVAGRARDREIGQFMEMTAGAAMLAWERGELVVVNGRLRTTEEALTSEGIQGFFGYQRQVQATKDTISQLTEELEAAEAAGNLSAVEDLTTRIDAAQRRLSGLAGANREAQVTAESAASAFAFAGDAAEMMEEQIADAQEAMEDLSEVGKALAKVMDPRAAAKDAALLAQRFEDQRAEITREAALERRRIEREELAERYRQQARDYEDAQAILEQIRRGSLAEHERIEREFQMDVLPRITRLSQEEQAEIRAAYDERIKAATKDQKSRLLGMFKAIGAAGKAAWNGIASAVRASVDALGGMLRGMMDLIGFSVRLSDGLNAVRQALEDAAQVEGGGTRTLSPEEVAKVARDAAVEFVQEMVNNAATFVLALADALPALVETLVESLPTLLSALVENLPIVIQAVIAAIPQVVQAVAQSLPVIITALAAGIPDLVAALLDQIDDIIAGVIQALPPLIDALIAGMTSVVGFLSESLPTIITDLMSGLPAIIDGLLAAVPEMIVGLIGSIPGIIQAVVQGIPDIIDAVLSRIPDILIALIEGVILAIPQIVMSVIEAVPRIILSVTENIPAIILAVVSRIPLIITEIIGMVPDIIIAVAQMLPEIIAALIALLPELTVGIIQELPNIARALLEAIFLELLFRLPEIIFELAKGIGQAIWEAITGIWDAVKELVSGLFTNDSDGDGVRDRRDRDPDDPTVAYSGINYVPATMRMTLHEGEAVIPASRNGRRYTSGMDPALAGAQGFQGGQGQGARVALDVILGGQVVDRVLVDAAADGKAPGITRMLRRESGTKVGFSPGRFNRWSK